MFVCDSWPHLKSIRCSQSSSEDHSLPNDSQMSAPEWQTMKSRPSRSTLLSCKQQGHELTVPKLPGRDRL